MTKEEIATLVPDQRKVEDDDGRAALGKWYWVKGQGKEEKPWFGCVTHVGTNFVEIHGPDEKHNRSTHVIRVHFDEFWQVCEEVANPDAIIDSEIQKHQTETHRLMNKVRELTARLGVSPKHELEDGATSDVKALSIRTSEPVKAYKKALIKAKEKTLPDLFKEIQNSNGLMATWMKVKLLPLEAEARKLEGTIDLVKDRIFSVELYAGLVEEAERVREGAPAPNDTRVHLMQRRAYMDEECLVGYEHGGMDYKNIEDFEGWLCKPANFTRLLPHPRTLLAFRVRRNDKERDVDLTNFIRVMHEKNWDKSTFLYVRNGEQLWRIETEIEFEKKLFPDAKHKIFSSSKLWAKNTFLHDIDDVITDEEYQGKVEEEKALEEKLKSIPEKDRWHHRRYGSDSSENYHEFTPDNVYYDDIMAVIEAEKKKHNRLVLVMQGLLDRSPVLHPHPPWQLWTKEGFASAFELVYDDTRALSAGDKPDFETYRARLNSHLQVGSVTVGQEVAWEIREAERENRKRRNRGSYHRSDYEYKRLRPQGDPGPGKVAVVVNYSEKSRSVTYEWLKEKDNQPRDVRAFLKTGEENVLNVDAYKPGDFHIFFDDPRTRQEYLQWAPLLLEAEECHAGNREIKPNRRLPAVAREPKVHGERPVDLAFKEKPPASPLSKKYEGKLCTLNYDTETKGGVKFKEGETLKIESYFRKHVSLRATDGSKRLIRNVHINHVTIIKDDK